MQTALFNKFDRKFKELERRTGGDPSRIEWLVRNCPDVRCLVGTLYFWHAEFSAHLIDRTHVEAYPWFISRYREYRERYFPRIQAVYGRLSLEALVQDEVNGIPAEEILYPEGPRADSETRFQYFMPGIRGEAEAIELVFHWAYNMSDGSAHEEELVRGVEAWEYFTETIGIDLAGIEERWAKLPRAIVPMSASAAPGDQRKARLLDLLDNASKAYVFGLPAAAVAICRAVCELVLKTYYVEGEAVGDSLIREVIPLAERRYEWLVALDLKRYVRFTNTIMHEGARPAAMSEVEDETVRQFLETIKTLIERGASAASNLAH